MTIKSRHIVFSIAAVGVAYFCYAAATTPEQGQSTKHNSRADCAITETDARTLLLTGRQLGRTAEALEMISNLANVCTPEKEALAKYK